MKYLLIPWLLFALPAEAVPTKSTEDIPPEEICELVDYEVTQAVEFGLIDEATAWSIVTRCYVNYG